MKLLVIGGGGREHALAWKLAQSPARAEGVRRAWQRRHGDRGGRGECRARRDPPSRRVREKGADPPHRGGSGGAARCGRGGCLPRRRAAHLRPDARRRAARELQGLRQALHGAASHPKAHPRDDAGKRFIQEIVTMTKRIDLFGKVVFLEAYDINVARHMVAGADVWLNTPRRPMEASGTSGMKALIHGGINMSTDMDGWWREAYDGENGWKIGEDTPASSEQEQDDRDAALLRACIENESVPLYYERGKDGLPHRWLKMVRHSMTTLIPRYSTDRMVIQYIRECYRPVKHVTEAQQTAQGVYP